MQINVFDDEELASVCETEKNQEFQAIASYTFASSCRRAFELRIFSKKFNAVHFWYHKYKFRYLKGIEPKISHSLLKGHFLKLNPK